MQVYIDPRFELPEHPFPDADKKVEMMLRRFRAMCWVTLQQRDQIPPKTPRERGLRKQA